MNRRPFVAIIAATTLLLAACGSSNDPLKPAASGSTSGAAAGSVIVGSADFAESELLAEVYAAALRGKGVTVTRVSGIGKREVYLGALKDGSIDLIPEYNGALLANLLSQKVPEDVNTPEEVFAALGAALPAGVVVLKQSAAEDKDTMTVTRATANKYSLKTIEDLAPVAKDFVVAAAPEFAKRYQGAVGLKSVYGIEFKEQLPLDAGGPLSLSALLKGDAQVADIFSTDSAIVKNDLVSLTDTKNLFLSQNILPLIRKDKATEAVTAALEAVSAALTTENLTAALAKVTLDKKSPSSVAADLLKELGIG
jgi:osmoprotectant transport system substrate-binding protein